MLQAQTDVDSLYVGYGPEDIAFDNSQGYPRLLVPCANRRETEPEFTEVISIDLRDHSIDTLKRTNEPADLCFRPHGIDLITNDVGETKVFFTCHSHIDEKTTIDRVVKYRLERDELVFEADYVDKTKKYMRSPNDVAALPDESFYISNDSWKKTKLGLAFEKIFQRRSSRISYYDKDKGWRVVAKRMAYANGIQATEDQVMVAGTFKKDLRIYQRSPNGDLTKTDNIKVASGLDNITYVNESQVLIPAHTKFTAFLKHLKDPQRYSPQAVYLVDLKTKEVSEVFANDGSLVNACATAYYYNGKLYLGQVFNPYILVVDMPKLTSLSNDNASDGGR